ncbi:MAG: hypothetical protein Q7S45_04365 [Candidatus Curtissbacteria bacterium]|nr:hypothetical protein [Candidatus Curtissbacteria bacterium]
MIEKSSRVNLYLKSLLVIAAILIGLAVFEIFTRFIIFSKSNPTTQIIGTCKKKDTYLYTAFIPNSRCSYKTKEWSATYVINSLGFRDFEYSLDKPNNTYRILIMGDSFFEGVGVDIENTAGKILERKIKQNSKLPVEVIQVGTAGWSPLLEYLYLVKFGIKFHPDLVIQTINATDFKDEYFFDSHLTPEAKKILQSEESSDLITAPNLKVFDVSDSSSQSTNKQSEVAKIKSFLTSHFILFKNLETLKNAYSRRFQKDKISDNLFAITELQKPKDYNDAFKRPEKYILKNRELLDKNGTDFLLVVFPHGQVLNGQEWKDGRLDYGFKRGVTYSNRALDDLISWSHDVGIDALDLTSDMRQASGSRKLFFDQDGHWNENGHRVFADLLADQIFKKTYIK